MTGRLPALMPSLRDAGDGPGRVFASPRARRYADEYGVDIALLAGRGTGVDGRVVEADVVAFYEEQQAQKKAQRVSPLAARVAAAHGVPVEEVPGSGHARQGHARRRAAAGRAGCPGLPRGAQARATGSRRATPPSSS